jgi:hypothetical protein
MINTLLKKATETFNKSTVSKALSQPDVAPEPPKDATLPIPSPAPKPAPAPEPTVEPQPIDQSPRALALRAAEAAGWKAGDVQPMAEICPHQPSDRFLLVTVNDWGDSVICHVSDAMSWRPEGAPNKCLPPPHNRIGCRFTGTATAEGRLIFESADRCKANRLRRSGR